MVSPAELRGTAEIGEAILKKIAPESTAALSTGLQAALKMLGDTVQEAVPRAWDPALGKIEGAAESVLSHMGASRALPDRALLRSAVDSGLSKYAPGTRFGLGSLKDTATYYEGSLRTPALGNWSYGRSSRARVSSFDTFRIDEDAFAVRQFNQSRAPKDAESAMFGENRDEFANKEIFPNVPIGRLRELKQAHWETVKDLDLNDPQRILYDRRFSHNMMGNEFRAYVVDEANASALVPVKPYQSTLQIPSDTKLGIVIGYHHLEKPFGLKLKEQMIKQLSFPANQVEFIEIKNHAVLTGEHSPASVREVRDAIARHGISHVVDVHEQMSTGDHYMNNRIGLDRNIEFMAPGNFEPTVPEHTLDKFVPTYLIEESYKGRLLPDFQTAINDHLKDIEKLVSSMQ